MKLARPIQLLTITAVAGAISAPPLAAQQSTHHSAGTATQFNVEVPHEDLDLTTEKGVARLEERIRTRIRQGCANGGRDSASVKLERKCRASTLAQTEPKLRFAIRSAHLSKERLARNAKATTQTNPDI